MTQGLQIFDANGDIILDVTDRLTRVLGSMNTGTSATTGSFVDSNFLLGDPWFYVYSTQAYDYRDASFSVKVDGSVMSWEFKPGRSGSNRKNRYIIYGVY